MSYAISSFLAVFRKPPYQVRCHARLPPSGDHTRIAFIRDAAGKVNGAVLNPGPWEPRRIAMSNASTIFRTLNF
jgi:hypothetical protein